MPFKIGNTKYGRGGGGMKKFCFALLDWRTTDRGGGRNAWVAPENQNVEGSAIWHANRGNVGLQYNNTIHNRFQQIQANLNQMNEVHLNR